MNADRGLAALAERLHEHYEHANPGPRPHDHPVSPTHLESAAAILGERGVFLPEGLIPWKDQVASDMPLRAAEAEIARLRRIEEAARSLFSAAFSGDDYLTMNSIPMEAPKGVVRKVRALRAALEGGPDHD